MVSCEAPNQKLNYIFSCDLLAQIQIKIGKLEGERKRPGYKHILENPVLAYSGAYQHLDLYVTIQVFANNQELCMPVKTSYKHIDKEPWLWDEWITLPLRFRDLPRNALLVITVWDIESAQSGDVPVCGCTITLFDKYGEFRQGSFELRMWPNKVGDGNSKTTTPGLLSDQKEVEIEESSQGLIPLDEPQNSNQSNNLEEFPMLDELDRLAKMSKYYADGQMLKQEWLDKLTLKEIQNATKKEKLNSKFFFMSIEMAQIKCEDVKYRVLYHEENAERIVQTKPNSDLFVVYDPELELDNIIELKNRKLEHSKQMGLLDMNLKPDTDDKNLLHKIINYPMTRPLKREEQTLLWNYRYYLTQNKKALSKFLQCFDLDLEFEGNTLMELMLKWQPMDIEDALELLGSKYKKYPKIRSYAISRLRYASNEDLILYLLQLVQALRYENFSLPNSHYKLPTIKSITTDGSLTLSSSSAKTGSTTTSATRINQVQNSSNSSSSSSLKNKPDNLDENNFAYSSSPPLATQSIIPNRNLLFQSEPQNTFDLNLKSFLLERATQNEIVALCLYWFVKVEIKDSKVLTSSSSSTNLLNQNQSLTNAHSSNSSNNITGLANQQYIQNNLTARTNFQIFNDELLETLRNGDYYARSIYTSITNQEKFLKALNDIVKATSREEGKLEKKLTKLISLLSDTSKSSYDLINLDSSIPLIIDPSIKIQGINVDKTRMFKSNLMPCKFVFKTLPSLDYIDPEYAVIYKIGDDLRQDQLVLQMIALMDKLLKQENLDLKLSPYKVVATGIKEGFLQFVDAQPVSGILTNSEYRTIREFLRKNNPSETEKYGIKAEAMDNYVKSSAGYIVITYILGVGDRHYDNILITKCGKILHIDFGYILGQDPKPFQPTIKWTKDLADGMGGLYGTDGKENKEYEDFKKYCCNAFLHLRRHANLILNLFSLMVDANIPGIALEPDKTVKKLIDRFKLDVNEEQAQYLLIKEIESNYDSFVGNITDVIHHYNTNRR